MANSKSNIYPIQLQGAELNLNKFDAEIKQYSGFNKNNAPFVGGCLSNLFTKDESIIGTNGDNVFIAPNGDIYQVTEEGLFKNDSKVIEYPSGTKFYEQEEISLPDNVVYYFNDDIYIRQLTSTTVELVCLGKTKTVEILLQNINFFIEKHTYNDVDFYIFVVKQKYKVQVCFFYDEDFLSYQFDSSVEISQEFYNTDILYDSCIRFASSDDTIFAVLVNAIRQGGGIGAAVIFQLDTEHEIVNYLYNNDHVESVDTSKTAYYLLDFFFTKDKYYVNNFQVPAGAHGDTGTLWIQGTYDIVFSSTLNQYCVKILTGEFSIPFKIGSSPSHQSPYCHVLKSWGVLYTFYAPADTTKLRLFGITDNYFIPEVSVGEIVSDAPGATGVFKRTVVNLGALIKDCVLTNNGFVSGISLPGGNILATEWNSVDVDYIFFAREDNSDFFVVYKNINTGKWYKIKEGLPKIKVCVSQIVSNANYYLNSYDVLTQKIKLYAPAWNNRAIPFYTVPGDLSLYNVSDASKNNSYTAKSMNEYSPVNNASLLLNPIPVIVAIGRTGIVQFWNNPNGELFVNNYIGTDENTIKYVYSFLLGYIRNNVPVFFTNRELSNLPFPSDTNGNVAYSPSLFAEFFSSFGNDIFVKEGSNAYQLSKYNNQPVMSFYLGTLVEGLEDVFILQGQYYGIINNQIFALQFYNGVVSSQTSVVSVQGLQFCGNTPYEALFYSKTNRCLYSFTGANVLNSKQFVDKIGVVTDYEYNPATQSIFLLTDIGVLVYSLFGTYQIDIPNAKKMYLLNNGVCIVDEDNNFRYVRYYKEDAEDGFIKQNIKLDTMFYGMNNETVTINDCLYVRLFSEEHEEGDLEVSATTLSLKGRMTEKTTFKIKASDWDEITHSIYLRYQPKEQRGLGISFKIESPFKIAALSVGSQADAILVDKVSKGAINSPQRTSNNTEW